MKYKYILVLSEYLIVCKLKYCTGHTPKTLDPTLPTMHLDGTFPLGKLRLFSQTLKSSLQSYRRHHTSV